MFPLMCSLKDTQTCVIYWGTICNPVACNVSGPNLFSGSSLGLLALTQNDVWSEELQLHPASVNVAMLQRHHKLCPGFISKCTLQKVFKFHNGAAEAKLKHTYTWTHTWTDVYITHTLTRSLIRTISSQSSGLPGRPATNTDRGGNRGKKRFWIERTGHDNFLPRGGGHAWLV